MALPRRCVHTETDGAPRFPGFPCRHMPCSQTPVVSRSLALSQPRTAAFRTAARRRRFHLRRDGYPHDHEYTSFGAQSHGLRPCFTQLQTPVTRLTCACHYRPVGSTLVWWDLESEIPPHPLGNIDEFQRHYHLIPTSCIYPGASSALLEHRSIYNTSHHPCNIPYASMSTSSFFGSRGSGDSRSYPPIRVP
jgi:hypothetical protein